MAIINFKEEFKDIVDVDNVKTFCFGSRGEDITPAKLIFAGGGSKFSSLCGFKFISKVNPKYNHGEFSIVFCAKLRSKIYRQATQNPSQWFAFLRTRQNEVQVLNKDFCKKAFDFDVDKFFGSDFFIKYSTVFTNLVKKGADLSDEMIAKQPNNSSDIYFSLPRYVRAIRESIPRIGYSNFNDKAYKLTMQFEDPNQKDSSFDAEKFSDFLKKDQSKDHSGDAVKYWSKRAGIKED